MSLPSSLVRSARSRLPCSVPSSSASSSIPLSKRHMGSAKPMPIVPYDPLRKLPDNHPLPPKGEIDIHTGQVRTTKGASFVHPLAKWDTFLDIPEDPKSTLGLTIANDPPIMPTRLPEGGSSKDDRAMAKTLLLTKVGLTNEDVNHMHRYTMAHKRVVNMTKGGRIAQQYVMTVVGHPEKHLLGIGAGKASTVGKAIEESYADALKNLDTVNLYQRRTVWGSGKNMSIKYGAVEIQFMARPPGFGLRCSPMMHRIFSACGIRDISAKMFGSKNKMQSIKAVAHFLQGGSAPQGMGDGFGGDGRREDKGRGMRCVQDIELERGRYNVEIHSKIERPS